MARRNRVGTTLGAPTWAEVADLVAAQSYNLSQLDLNKACAAWAAADPQGYGAWAASVSDATGAMNAALDRAKLMAQLNSGAPFVQWQAILDAAKPLDDLVRRFMKAGYCKWQTTGTMPQPTAPDFDLKAYVWTGKALDLTSSTFRQFALLAVALLVLREVRR